MKKIECLIKPFKLDDIKTAICDLGIAGMTVSEARGFGRQKGHAELYRGAEYQFDFIPKLKLELVVPADQLDAVVATVLREGSSGRIGNGKIFVSPIERSMRIRAGESDRDSL